MVSSWLSFKDGTDLSTFVMVKSLCVFSTGALGLQGLTLAMNASVSGVLCEAEATMVSPGSVSENSVLERAVTSDHMGRTLC